MVDLAITGGTVVTHEDMFKADICVQNGRIAALVQPGQAPAAKESIDAGGLLVFPGAIDCHAHFQVPGYTHRETFETGSRAAAAGGITTVVDMPLNNDPPVIDADAFRLKQGLVQGESYVDYAFWGGVVDGNLHQLEGLKEAGAVALKGFLSPVKEGTFVSISLWQLLQAMNTAKDWDIPIGLHCEDYTLLQEGKKDALAKGKKHIEDFLAVHSPLAERIAVSNVIELCREVRARVHICHVSHPGVAQLIYEAQLEGLPITAETCPHYLGFTAQRLHEVGSLAKCTPPLRGAEDVDALWEYVVNGCLSCVGSDHSPSQPEEKDDEKLTIWQTWGGLNGVQFLLPYFYHLAVNERGLPPTQVAASLAYHPARVFALKNKGRLAPGYDADITLLDPKREWTVTSDNVLTMHKDTVYMGVQGRGMPVRTLLRGQTTAREGQYLPQAKGTGCFLPK